MAGGHGRRWWQTTHSFPYPECRPSGETLPPLPTARGGRAKTLVSRCNSVLKTVNRFTPPSRKRKASNYSTVLRAISKHCGLSSIPYPHLPTAPFTRSHRSSRTASCYRFDLAQATASLTASRYSMTESSYGASQTASPSGKSPSSIPYPVRRSAQLSSHIRLRTDIVRLGLPTATSRSSSRLKRLASGTAPH